MAISQELQQKLEAARLAHESANIADATAAAAKKTAEETAGQAKTTADAAVKARDTAMKAYKEVLTHLDGEFGEPAAKPASEAKRGK